MFLTDVKIKRSDNLTYVIARYQEDISWADNIDLKFVVQKDLHLPNLGRETSSYLWYIKNYYKDLNGIYQFCQGRPNDHQISVFDHWSDLNGLPHHRGLNIQDFANKINLKIPNTLNFTAGAQFKVSSLKIQLRDLEWYENAYVLSLDYPLSAYIFERIWKYVFFL